MANIEKIDNFMQHTGVPRSDHAFMYDLRVDRTTTINTISDPKWAVFGRKDVHSVHVTIPKRTEIKLLLHNHYTIDILF